MAAINRQQCGAVVATGASVAGSAQADGIAPTMSRLRAVPFLTTLAALALAGALAWEMWQAYMAAPWTRDGTVRAYVVTAVPEVAGRIVQLPVSDNQVVRKGDVLLVIDPTDYATAVAHAEAVLEQARINANNAGRQAQRRSALSTLEVSEEQKQTYAANAAATQAGVRQALAQLAQARTNLERTTIRSPVNGYVTNLLVQRGDYAAVGKSAISVVDSDSFWIDGYFQEASLHAIRDGDPAAIRLIGYRDTLLGHVDSVARGITVANAAPGQGGLASVNPIFTWVRLAQRIPVRIHIDRKPYELRLVAGQTASVEIKPRLTRR